MKKVEFPLTEEMAQEIYNFLNDENKMYDVVFLDRALIAQFKTMPEGLTVCRATDYIKFLTEGFLASLYNYEYELQSDDAEKSE